MNQVSKLPDGHIVRSNSSGTRDVGEFLGLLSEHARLEAKLTKFELDRLLWIAEMSKSKGFLGTDLPCQVVPGPQGPNRNHSLREARLVGRTARQLADECGAWPATAVALVQRSDDLVSLQQINNQIEQARIELSNIEQTIMYEEPATVADVAGMLRFLSLILRTSCDLEVDYVAIKLDECCHTLERKTIGGCSDGIHARD